MSASSIMGSIEHVTSSENRTARAPSPVQGPWYWQEPAQSRSHTSGSCPFGLQKSSTIEVTAEHVSVLGLSTPGGSSSDGMTDMTAWNEFSLS